jgi:hypothetical protein
MTRQQTNYIIVPNNDSRTIHKATWLSVCSTTLQCMQGNSSKFGQGTMA